MNAFVSSMLPVGFASSSSFVTRSNICSTHTFVSRPASPNAAEHPPSAPHRPTIIRNTATQPEALDAVMSKVISRLRDELPNVFSAETADYSIYSPDVYFEDPLTRFRGTARYIANINFLSRSPVFATAKFHLHDIRVLLQSPSTVRTRWTLSMTLRAIPWRPRVAFTGQSDYVVDQSSALVVRHIDYWDSVPDSAFFSFPAVADLVRQCGPSSPFSANLVPEFILLRRLASFQIWRFSDDVMLVPEQSASASSSTSPPVFWKIATSSDKDVEPVNVRDIAVFPLPTQDRSPSAVRNTAEHFRSQLSNVAFAKPLPQSFCVHLSDASTSSYQIWVPLSTVSTAVDE